MLALIAEGGATCAVLLSADWAIIHVFYFLLKVIFLARLPWTLFLYHLDPKQWEVLLTVTQQRSRLHHGCHVALPASWAACFIHLPRALVLTEGSSRACLSMSIAQCPQPAFPEPTDLFGIHHDVVLIGCEKCEQWVVNSEPAVMLCSALAAAWRRYTFFATQPRQSPAESWFVLFGRCTDGVLQPAAFPWHFRLLLQSCVTAMHGTATRTALSWTWLRISFLCASASMYFLCRFLSFFIHLHPVRCSVPAVQTSVKVTLMGRPSLLLSASDAGFAFYYLFPFPPESSLKIYNDVQSTVLFLMQISQGTLQWNQWNQKENQLSSAMCSIHSFFVKQSQGKKAAFYVWYLLPFRFVPHPMLFVQHWVPKRWR